MSRNKRHIKYTTEIKCFEKLNNSIETVVGRRCPNDTN